MANRRELRDIISNYGKQCFFSLKEVGEIIGLKDFRAIERWLSDMEFTTINGRKKYFINDIARKLDNAKSA